MATAAEKDAEDDVAELLGSLAIDDAIETSKQQEVAIPTQPLSMTDAENEAGDVIAGLFDRLAIEDAAEKKSKQHLLLGDIVATPAAPPMDANAAALQAELDKAGFEIFECIADKGYLTWKPPRSVTPLYQDLSSITAAKEITRYINRDGKPDKLVRPTSRIRVPQAFLQLPPQEYANKFPYGQHEIASLHVAVQDRGVDLHHDIDFVFGGSTLDMLANCDNENPYMLTRISGTSAIIITKQKQYIADFSTFGFQFERLATGKRIDDLSDVVDSVEHLQVMKVGTYRVLFLAETDAVLADHGPPVEIKASSPYHWKTKVMFQMISSGSTKLCHGVKQRGKLTRVDLKSLSSVAKDALKGGQNTKQLEQSILTGMDNIMTQMNEEESDEDSMSRVFKIHFEGKSLQLLPVESNSTTMLPPTEIVRELLSTSP
jgi:hypothetical protein